jgi:hypothetical protein
LYFVQLEFGCLTGSPYRDKKVVGVFVRFRAPRFTRDMQLGCDTSTVTWMCYRSCSPLVRHNSTCRDACIGAAWE